jgi:hypothetical protein
MSRKQGTVTTVVMTAGMTAEELDRGLDLTELLGPGEEMELKTLGAVEGT